MENKIAATREQILWLRSAIKTFYPAFFYSPEEAAKQGIPTTFAGYKKTEILGHIFSITRTEDVSDALVVLDYWLNLLDYPESDMPAYELLQNEIDPVIKEVVDAKDPEKRKSVGVSIKHWQQRLEAAKKGIPQPARLKEKIKYQESLTKPPEVKEEAREAPPTKIPSVIYLNSSEPPEKNILSDEDNIRLEAYIDEVRLDPNAFVERRVREIIENIPESAKRSLSKEQLDFVARGVVLDITDKLLNIDKGSLGVAQVNPVEILKSLTNPASPHLTKIIPDEKLRAQIADAAQQSMSTIIDDNLTSQSLLEPVFGPSLAGYFYNTNKGVRDHEISEKPNENTNYEVSVQDLINHWRELSNVKSKIYEAIRAESPEVAKGLTTKTLDEIARKYSWYQKSVYGVRPLAGGVIPWVTTSANVLGTTWKGTGIYKPILGSYLTESYFIGKAVYLSEKGLVEMAGIRIGGVGVGFGKISLGNIIATETPSVYSLAVFTKTGSKTIAGPALNELSSLFFKKITPSISKVATAGKAVSSTLSKFLVKTLGTKAATFIASNVIPVIGQVVSAIQLLSIVKDIASFLKTWWAKNKQGSVLTFALGLLTLGFVIPGTIGAFFLAGSLFSGTGYLMMRAGGVKPTGTIIAQGFRSIAYGIIHGPIAAITLPAAITAIALPALVAIILFIINTGAYIVPPSSFELVVTENPYIGIEKVAFPKRVDNPPPGRTINYTITIKAKKGTLTNINFSYSCKVMGESQGVECPSVTLPNPPDVISPTQPFAFSYSVTYNNISNSIVSDTITVKADAPDAPNQEAKGSESVTIGNPPTGCYNISDNKWKWPGDFYQKLYSAINTLIGEYAPFVEKVCSGGGTVNLCYDPPGVSLWGYHSHTSDCDILFGAGGFGNEGDALYILTHESSHHIGKLNGDYGFQDSGAEYPLCSYAATSLSSEAFAEGNALYVQLPSFWSSRCGSSSFQEKYPLNWKFADEKIFH